ncbi:hypothetical protein CVT24_011148 [Panaeolus cyanescens]|uniref:Uncharacterized protein n=1 Tax=Panaeolus cyanescens TaxID=181874 RepID=A0A409YG46_9AGAR|nr:hypothetical protein CVT24_011148 [Panaeolus cyanescens]
MTTVQRIDNANPRVVYRGTWAPMYNDKDALNETLTLARDAGTSASLTFTGATNPILVHTPGTRISVYGVLGGVDPNNPVRHVTTYDLDNLPRETFMPDPPANPPVKGLRFWESPVLENGQHTLTMTNTLDRAERRPVLNGLNTIDAYTYPKPVQSLISSPNSKSSNSSVGAIVGAALGGVIAALLIAGLIIYLVWRKKRRSKTIYPGIPSQDSESVLAQRPPYTSSQGYTVTNHSELVLHAPVSPYSGSLSSSHLQEGSSPTGPLMRGPVISGTILPSKIRRDLASTPAQPPAGDRMAPPTYSE